MLRTLPLLVNAAGTYFSLKLNLKTLRSSIYATMLLCALTSCNSTVEPDAVFMQAKPMGSALIHDIETRNLTDDDLIAQRAGDYRIQHGDQFELMVEGQIDTLTIGIPLTPKGFMHYQLCKPFKAAGMTLYELKKRLEFELDGFFLEPKVFVNLVVNSANQYHILGQVRVPGSYTLELPIQLREAIYDAGGTAKGSYRGSIKDLADLDKSYIIRESIKLEVDFKKLMHENDPMLNPYLRPGDYIYIAAREAREVYILGAVTSRAFFHTNDLTILQVLSSIRYSLDATQSKAIIMRNRLTDNPVTIEINLDEILAGEAKDIYLQPDDIIYIPEKPFLFVRNLIKTAVRAYVNTFASDASRFIATEHVFKNGQ